MDAAAKTDHHSAIVRLFTPDGEIAGLGVLVTAQKVLTCAHVVNVALGVANRYESDTPELTRLMRLEFPFVKGAPRFTATLVEGGWAPPPPKFGADGSDVAVLQLRERPERPLEAGLPSLTAAPMGAEPAVFSWDPGPRKGSLWVFGYPGKPPRSEGMPVDLAVWGMMPGGRIVVQSTTGQSVKAQPGYSGSPVWRDDPAEVVGLLHAAPPAEAEERDGYVIPTEMIAAAWSEFAGVAVPANPYRALEPFAAEDSTSFFGRESETRALYDAVMKRSITLVSGASGVGKSSLVQAGLIPHLRMHPIQNRSWVVAQFRPGLDPLLHLATALLRAERRVTKVAGVPSKNEAKEKATELRAEGLRPTFEYFRSVDHELLIVADQFEEGWTASPLDRATLTELLLPTNHDEGDEPDVHIVLTMRSDVLLELQDEPGIGPRLAGRLMPLSPLTLEALRQVIEEPAMDRGVNFEDELVDEIISDAGTPASLPLLEFTLHELWEHQSRRTLTREAYRALGTVGGALDRYADDSLDRFDDHSQAAADRILLRMVRTISTERQITTRQRVARGDLAGQESIVKRLIDSRLVESDGDSVELAHEALITSWGRLRRLVGENAKFLNWLEVVRGRSADDPLSEPRLVEAERWAEVRGADIPMNYLDLIRVSREALDERRKEQERARLTEDERARALEVAESLRLATEAVDTAGSEADVALLVAWEAVLQDRNEYTESVFRDVLALLPVEVDTLARAGGQVTVGFVGQRTVFAASPSGYVWFWRIGDAAVGRLFIPGEADLVVAPTPEGRALLAYRDGILRAYDPMVVLSTRPTGSLPPAAGEIALSDAGTTQRSSDLRVNVTVSNRRTCLVRDGDVGWLVDLQEPWSVIREFRFAGPPFPLEDLERLQASDPDALRSALEENRRLRHSDRLYRAALDPTGAFVVTEASGGARVFPVDGTPPTRLEVDGGVASTCVLADGAVVTGTMGGEGAIWNVDGSRRVLFREPTEGRDLFIRGVDASGMRFATAPNSGSVVDVRDASGTRVASFRGRDGEHFWSAAFSPDGRLLAAGSSDRTVRVWEVQGDGDPLILTGHTRTVDTVAFHPLDSDLLLSSDQGGEVRMWRLNPPGLMDWTGRQAEIRQLQTINPGVVVSSDSVSVRVWSEDGTSTDLGGPLLDILEPAGTDALVLTAADDQMSRLWSVGRRVKEVARLAPQREGSAASRSIIAPDGRHVLQIIGDLAFLQTVKTGEVVPLERGGINEEHLDSFYKQIVGQGFDLDGARVAVAAKNGGVWIWTSEGEQVASFVTAYGNPDRTLAFACDPQGEYIATGVRGEVGLRDWAGNKVGVVPVSGYKVFNVGWSPDGERIVTIADDPGGGNDILQLWTREPSLVSTLDWIPDGAQGLPLFDRQCRYWTIRSGQAIAIIGRDGQRLGLLARPRGTWLIGPGAISLDGKLVAASFSDGAALIWSFAERRRVKKLRIGEHTAITFSPDGRTLMAGRSNGVISRFAIDTEDLFSSAAKRVTRALTSGELDRLGITRSRLNEESLETYRTVI